MIIKCQKSLITIRGLFDCSDFVFFIECKPPALVNFYMNRSIGELALPQIDKLCTGDVIDLLMSAGVQIIDDTTADVRSLT